MNLKNIKKIIYFIAAAILAAYGVDQKDIFLTSDSSISPKTNSSGFSKNQVPSASSQILTAYNNQLSNIQVKEKGIVVKVLADDIVGSRHQKFIVRIDKLSILIAHNIDLAAKITGLKKGDSVEFYGEYEWNVKGGIVHWTHHDPAERHIDGWLKFKGKKYQ